MLLLTRPYNLNEVQGYIELEAECLGLSESHLKQFIESELGRENASILQEYLDDNPNICHFARVPVTANILCTLWKEQQSNQKMTNFDINLYSLYDRMANLVWKRYIQKITHQVNGNKVFEVLEELAFDALKAGRIQIELSCLLKCHDKNVMERTLKESGFILMKKEGCHFQFAHLTFQEYFTAKWLAKRLFDTDETRRRQAERFVQSKRHKDFFRTTFIFLGQAVSSQREYEGLNKLLSLSYEEPQNRPDARKYAVFNLTLIDGYLSSLHNEPPVELSDNPKIAETINLTFGILKDISISSFFKTTERSFLDEIKHARRALCHFQKLFRLMLEGITRFDSDGVIAMVELAAYASKRSQQHATVLIEFMNKQSAKGILSIRQKMPKVMSVVAKATPNRHDAILKLAEAATTDQAKEVRSTMAECLHYLAEAVPDRHDEILKLVESALADGHELVRRSMVEKLPKLAEAMPKRHDPILKLLETALTDRHAWVRSGIAEKLLELAKAMHSSHDAIFKFAETALMDEHEDVREEMVTSLPQLAKEMPERHDAVFKFAETALMDEDWWVREETVTSLLQLAEVMPHHQDGIFKLVKAASTDRDQWVRRCMAGKLPKLAKAMPKRRDAVVLLLQYLLNDEDNGVRHTAETALRRL